MMTAEQLKASILQMAMQGKLVEQRAEEGTGAELYELIQQEKSQLVHKKIIPKSNSFESISEDEIPFDIPESWEWVRICEVSTVVTGGTPSKSHTEYYGDIFPFYKPADIQDGKYLLDASDFLSEEGKNASRVIPRGSIAVNCIGNIGKSAILPKDGTTNQQINSICYFPNPDFMYWVCQSSVFVIQLKNMASMTTIPIVNKSKMERCIIPLPPLEEQKRIVAKIEELMPFVEQYAKASTRLNTLNVSFPEQMKKSILQQAVMGKLVPQGPSDEPVSVLLKKIAAKCVIPEELENDINPSFHYAHLADACNGIYDCPHSTPTYCKEYEGYLCLRTRELKVGEIEWDKLLYITKDTYTDRVSRYMPRKDDIVYAREGRYGICAIIDKDTPLALGQRLMVFSLNHELLRPKYLFYALISDFCLGQVTSVQRGMTAAHVNVKDVKKMIVPIPSLKMQDRIISIVDYLLSEIETLNKSHDE